MRRDSTPYADRPARVMPEGYGIDISGHPVPGYYRMRLRSGGAPVGIRIWYGAPLDPLTGEEMDRSLRWQAQCNGEYIDLDRVWPVCAHQQITEIEYHRHCKTQKWARDHIPDDALADPRRAPDHLSTPMMF